MRTAMSDAAWMSAANPAGIGIMQIMNDAQQIRIGIIGGSGLGDALGAEPGEAREVDTPFGKPSSPITLTQWQGVDIAILQRHGPGHTYAPSHVPYRANIFALKSLGVTHIVASGATGSLCEHIQPGDLLIADQVIDKTHQRISTFYEHAAVHVEFAEPFCAVMRQWLLDASNRLSDSAVHDGGTYVCMEGPAFSTKAESNMHRAWGGDVIGMTAMPEAKLAREAEIAYALVALPTDYDCWKPHDPNMPAQQLLSEIIGNLHKASAAGVGLIRAALSDVSRLRDHPSPAHDALKLAIWSDKSKIDPQEVQRLDVLWGRYF
jgi:5'-methylthioadenosine phosphorylase